MQAEMLLIHWSFSVSIFHVKLLLISYFLHILVFFSFLVPSPSLQICLLLLLKVDRRAHSSIPQSHFLRLLLLNHFGKPLLSSVFQWMCVRLSGPAECGSFFCLCVYLCVTQIFSLLARHRNGSDVRPGHCHWGLCVGSWSRKRFEKSFSSLGHKVNNLDVFFVS